MTTVTATGGPSKEDILEAISNLTVLELNDLVKTIEEKFGVKASLPTVQLPATEQSPTQSEKTEFDVVLISAGEKRIQTIKAVRELTALGLKESKDLVENVPKTLKADLGKAQAEEWKKKLEEAGATVELK